MGITQVWWVILELLKIQQYLTGKFYSNTTDSNKHLRRPFGVYIGSPILFPVILRTVTKPMPSLKYSLMSKNFCFELQHEINVRRRGDTVHFKYLSMRVHLLVNISHRFLWHKNGRRQTKNDVWPTLRYLLSVNECKLAFTWVPAFLSCWICLTRVLFLKQGDSGGPLVYKRNDGRWTLMGLITATEMPCNVTHLPMYFIRISPFMNDFILPCVQDPSNCICKAANHTKSWF